jgi:hypothetical protein
MYNCFYISIPGSRVCTIWKIQLLKYIYFSILFFLALKEQSKSPLMSKHFSSMLYIKMESKLEAKKSNHYLKLLLTLTHLKL